MRNLFHLFFSVSASVLISIFRNPVSILIIGDIQTGAIILNIEQPAGDKAIFHGDQRAITVYVQESHEWSYNTGFCTYSVLDGTLLCQDELAIIPWVHRDTLQFATSAWPGTGSTVYIYQFQPTSSFSMLSSFPILDTCSKLTFSPVSFHISSVELDDKVIVYTVQNSKFLLRAKASNSELQPSPNDHFFAYSESAHYGSAQEICIWQNISTGYVPWSKLRPQFPFSWFSWSPSSTLILCWGSGESSYCIQTIILAPSL